MKIVRQPTTFLQKLIRVLDHDLSQLWIVRFFCGGTWFKTLGSWNQCDVIAIMDDGSRVLRWNSVSFHETHLSVQSIEDHS